MLTIKWDNATAMSRATPRRTATPYLRGIIIQVGNPAFEKLVNTRVLAWGDSDPIDDYKGTFADVGADLRDYVEVEGTNQQSLVLANILVKKTYDADESAALQNVAMLAQMGNLIERGARHIERPKDSDITERRMTGDQPGTSPEGVAGEALPGGVTSTHGGQAPAAAGGGVTF